MMGFIITEASDKWLITYHNQWGGNEWKIAKIRKEWDCCICGEHIHIGDMAWTPIEKYSKGYKNRICENCGNGYSTQARNHPTKWIEIND